MTETSQKSADAAIQTTKNSAGERDVDARVLSSGGDPLLPEFDRIRLAYDGIKRDRDRLRDVITTLRVNAIKGHNPDALIHFIRDGLGSIDAGLTIGEAIIAFEKATP